MSRKLLFLDGQVFQSAAWDRGMGKYSLALVEAMFNDKKYHFDDTFIIFTSNMPLAPAAKQRITDVAPRAKLLFCDLKIPSDPALADIPALQAANELLLASIIDERSEPVDERSFMMLSLFIDQVCSVFPANCKRVLLFYDLIPLQYSERYSALTSYQNYLARYKTLFEADMILTISNTVADDIKLNLGIDPQKIATINGAPIKRHGGQARKPKIKVPEKYILMPSGNEIRKNNTRAVQGFESYLNSVNDDVTKLVLTSFFDDYTITELSAYSSRLVFTGNVAEEELQWLYEHAEALLFVPEYEGLGLPILEAAEVGIPIACSNLTVFNEISPTAFYYSNPADPFSIAQALSRAMSHQELDKKLAEYPTILQHYTWAKTAQITLEALRSFDKQASQATVAVRKPKLAIMAPSPAGYSAIGKLVMQLHPALQEYFAIDYYLESGTTHRDFMRPNYLPYISTVYPAKELSRKRYQQYDAVLYHVGNSEFHVNTITDALFLPGFAIFHDTYLTNIFEGELLAENYITQERVAAERLLDKEIGNPKAAYISSLVNNQLGLIAHSAYTASALSKSSVTTATIEVLGLPTAVPEQLRLRPQETPLEIGLAGIIHPAKGLDIIERIAKLPEFYNCRIRIFGLSLVAEDTIRRLQDYSNVQVDIDVTDFQFQNLLSQLDVLINFRPDYRGETSLATLEAMRFGVVPIVRRIGWYDELPDDAVIKVNDEAEIMETLRRLQQDRSLLATMRQRGRNYIRQRHTYQAYAEKLQKIIQQSSKPALVARVAESIKSGASLNNVKKQMQDGTAH